MKLTIKYPPGIGPLIPLEDVADRITELMNIGSWPPPGKTKFTLDYGHAGSGWFKVES